MGLLANAGRLLAVGGRFITTCCCKKYKCVVIGVDSCGNKLEQCVEAADGNYFDPNCEGLCLSGGPCECEPPCDGCSTCEEGECVPAYGPCETCDDGEIVPLCGECETCVDGVCYPCPEGYVCVNGECIDLPPPADYYCCYSKEEGGSEPAAPRTASCQSGPCSSVIDGVLVLEPEREAGGPYTSATECGESCRPHNCTPDACGTLSCTPDDDGAFLTQEECAADCDDDGLCGLSGDPFTANGVGGGSRSYFFTVGAAEFTAGREICVSYASTSGHPIRVQIWSPDMSGVGCTQIASRTIKGDSQWRCQDECSCDFVAPGGCKGAPKGFVKWRTKQQGVTTFEVAVLTECAANVWQIGVTCGPCIAMPAIQCCCGPCVLDEPDDIRERIGNNLTYIDTTYSGYKATLNEPLRREKDSCDPDDYEFYLDTLLSQVVNAAKQAEYEALCYQVYYWVDMSYTYYYESGVEADGAYCFSDGWTTVKELRAFVSADCALTLEDKTSELITQTTWESDDCSEPAGCNLSHATPVYKTPKTPAVTCVNPLL